MELIQRIARGVNAYEASMARRCGVTVEYMRKEMGIASKSKGSAVYNPKINEELILRLYRLAKARKMPMTRLVDLILTQALLEMEENNKEQTNGLQNCRNEEPALPRSTSIR